MALKYSRLFNGFSSECDNVMIRLKSTFSALQCTAMEDVVDREPNASDRISDIHASAVPQSERNESKNHNTGGTVPTIGDINEEIAINQPRVSIFTYFRSELTRSYQLENDEARYSERREKVYTFMRMPWDVEKFMAYGFFQCADAFLFVFTFLPVRFLWALWLFITHPIRTLFKKAGTVDRNKRVLQPAQICDILKGITLIVCGFLMTYIDTSMMYHLIKSQSVIKLYIFFNMLEVADRLFSAFGQDLLDTLFWTATEPRQRKREHFGVVAHLILAILYVFLHAVLVLFQATTLNVAINSNNKALLTIMMSNNFVELKGSVFKKFEKNNLFQMSCSDVRERFHYFILLLTVIVQTMKEYSWKEDRFMILMPDCLMVLFSEFVVDWIKHAFITRFNEIPLDVYKDYTISLAYDLACSKNKHAFSDHSDLVSRRMGFIPLPLSVLLFRVASQSVKTQGCFALFMLLVGYLCLVSFKLLNSMILLGRACDLIEQHRESNAKQGNGRVGKSGMVQRCNSHPPSRKTSTDRVNRQPVVSKSVSHSRNPSFNGSIVDDVEMLGPNPIFCNSTVSLNSVGLNEALLEGQVAVKRSTSTSTLNCAGDT